MRLVLASSYAFLRRGRRLFAADTVAATAIALIAGALVLRASVAGLNAIDALTADAPERAFRLRVAVATSLFTTVILLRGIFGLRLGLHMPIERYLLLPFRFVSVYRAHLAWSLVGWPLLLVPVFAWFGAGRGSTPAAATVISWAGVVLFAASANAAADTLSSVLARHVGRAWRGLLLALAVIVAALAAAGDASLEGPRGVLLRWSPPGSLMALVRAPDLTATAWPFARLLLWAAAATQVAAAAMRSVYLHPALEAGDVARAGYQTRLMRVWWPLRSIGVPSRMAALVARDVLLFVRGRRLRLVCATAVGITVLYGLRPAGLSPWELTVLLCFPLALLTAIYANAFGFDRFGALGFLTLPPPISHVLLAKNLVYASVTVILTALGSVPVLIILGIPPAATLAAFAAVFAYLLCGFLAVGNIISIAFPKAIPLHSLVGWLNPVLSLPVMLAASGVLIAVPAVTWATAAGDRFLPVMTLALVGTAAVWGVSILVAAAWAVKRPPLLRGNEP